ncbi:MAG: hypothetical protein WA395_07900 [Nitrososphaeraceae archaeon]
MSIKLENKVAVITGATSGMLLLPLNYSSRKARMSSSPAAARKSSTRQSKKSARTSPACRAMPAILHQT